MGTLIVTSWSDEFRPELAWRGTTFAAELSLLVHFEYVEALPARPQLRIKSFRHLFRYMCIYSKSAKDYNKTYIGRQCSSSCHWSLVWVSYNEVDKSVSVLKLS